MNYWRIWFKVFEDDKEIGSGVWHQAYKYKSNAVRRAKQMWSKDLYNPMTGTTISRKWIVSQTNPWAGVTSDDSYIFSTMSDAENFMKVIRYIAYQYGDVTQADIKDYLNMATEPNDYKYGWLESHIDKVEIASTGVGYSVKFPRALPIR